MHILKLFFVGLLLLTFTGFGQAPAIVSFYLSSNQIPHTAKDYYYGKFKASDEARTLSIVDSLNTRNNTTRPFYIFLVSKMMNKTDGALAEAIGNAVKQFVERHPNEAIDFLYSKKPMFKNHFISVWAQQIAYELAIDCEGKEKQCIKKSLKQAIAKTKSENKDKLIRFYNQVENFLK